MAPILHMDSHQAHQVSWSAADNRHARSGGQYAPQQHHQQQWPPGSQVHLNPMVLTRDVADDGLRAPVHGVGMGPGRIASMGRDVLGDPSLTGRGYSIKRCQGFVRCDMDIDAEVVGWVIGKNGSTIKDMKHKTGCNMWVDQRALKLTITGPDVASVEHAAKSVDAYVAAAPIKAGAVEAAVTKTLECPSHLLDVLGDRTTIARIVKETHAQVVVNKKIGRIIVRGDHRSVDLAHASVQATINSALHGGHGMRVNSTESIGSHGGHGYFPTTGGGGSGSSGIGGGSRSLGAVSPVESMAGGGAGGMHMLSSAHVPDFRVDLSDFRSLGSWQHQQHHQQELQAQLQRNQHRSGDGRGSETDESEIETVSLGSIGARTPVSSTAGSPRAVASYNTSPALSGTASTPGGDWSLFSGGFGLGVAALQEGSSGASTPITARTSRRVQRPPGLQAFDGSGSGAGDPGLETSASTDGDVQSQGHGDSEQGEVEKTGAVSGEQGPQGAHAPPPSPASTTSGEASRRLRPLAAGAREVFELSDGEEESEDHGDKVVRLGRQLQAMGLGKYCTKFAENEVDLEALGLMSENDLADIGIPKGPRLKILNAVGSRGGLSHTDL
ncbi:unnamed protein product [Ascophyllum nodosum]